MKAKPVILVTGSNGQLGSELRDLAPQFTSFDFRFFSKEEFPIQDETIARNILKEVQPDYFLNCAAYTAVDLAETEQEKAMEINGKAVGMLARLCHEQHIRFLHISTDYVFNGQANTPWKEDAPVDPVNYYGLTKLKGEALAMLNNQDAIIIRTSWVYSYYGKNFVKTMLRLMKEKESIGVVNDQQGAPTYARDLAEAMLQIIASGKWVPGIYHYSNEASITWFEFATAIRHMTDLTCKVNAITTADFPTPAKRPAYSVMDLEKLKRTYGIEIKPWKESLQHCLKRLQS